MYFYFIVAIVVSLSLTAILLRIFIPKLKSMKMGQPIYEIGPRWHKSKEGTPTMGGLCFIVPITVVVITASIVFPDKLDLPRLWITVVSMR